MNKIKLKLISVLICVISYSIGFAQTPLRPFPQAMNWTNCIKPAVAQATMNSDIVSVYSYWKTNFLKTATTGGYYVEGEATGASEPSKGTSEGHGYGMIITALMAGNDANAKTYYDGLYQFFNTHRSTINNELMGWLVTTGETKNKFSSATDGDMDIAYSLLLAHYQWGSTGTINYLQEAKDMISKGLKGKDVRTTNKRTTRGDWDTHATASRSSDWMTSHFHAYYAATSDVFWNDAATTVYSMMTAIQSNYSATTGLMPDFIEGATPVPSTTQLETANDDQFYWNACRFPWRIAMDYGHYGNASAKTHINKVVNWAKTTTGGTPSNFKAGYDLNGTALQSYSDLAFTAPIVAASVIDPTHQAFLNSGWTTLKNGKGTYFGCSINLMCMLFISGNWWIPETTVTGPTDCNGDVNGTATLDGCGKCIGGNTKKVGFSATGIYDDLSLSENDMGGELGGLYYWDEPTGNTTSPNFKSIAARDLTNKEQKYTVTQPAKEYNPFGLSFGTITQAGANFGKTSTINLSANGEITVTLKNPSATKLTVAFALLDSNDQIIDHTAAASVVTPANFANEAYLYAISTELLAGETKTVSFDFKGGYYGDYTLGKMTQLANLSIISGVMFTVTNANVDANYEPLALSNTAIVIKSLQVGKPSAAEDCSLSTNVMDVQNDNTSEFTVFPNPSSNQITVVTNNTANIQIIDVYGKVLMTGLPTNSSIDISSLKSGVYFIQNTHSLKYSVFIKE